MTLFAYLLRLLVLAFCFAVVGIGLIVMPPIGAKAVQVVGGVGFGAIVSYLPLVLIELVPYVLPLAFLLASVATFGRLAADNELTAVRMAGVHPLRLLVPGLCIALALSVCTDWMLSNIAPAWKYQARSFKNVARVEEARRLIFERNEIDLPYFSLWAESSEGDVKREVMLSYLRKGEPFTIWADEMRLAIEGDELVVHLVGAKSGNPDFQFESQDPVFRIPMERIVGRNESPGDAPKYKLTSELRRDLRSPHVTAQEQQDLLYAIHSRHALAATYLVFFLLGAPTGVFLRAGTQLAAFTAAIGYAFLYYLLSLRLGKQLSAFGSVPAPVAAWSTDVLFGLLAAFLVRRGLFR